MWVPCPLPSGINVFSRSRYDRRFSPVNCFQAPLPRVRLLRLIGTIGSKKVHLYSLSKVGSLTKRGSLSLPKQVLFPKTKDHFSRLTFFFHVPMKFKCRLQQVHVLQKDCLCAVFFFFLRQVDWAFDGGAGSEILVKAFNADLSRRDLRVSHGSSLFASIPVVMPCAAVLPPLDMLLFSAPR